VSQPEASNSGSQLAKVEPEVKVPGDKWAEFGRPLLWNGVVRIAFGGILVMMALVGVVVIAVRANAVSKSVQEGDKQPPLSDPAKAKAKDIGFPKNEVDLAAQQKALAAQQQALASGMEICLPVPILLGAVIAGLGFAIHGLKLVLQPVYVPAGAPGKINGTKDVELLMGKLDKDDLYLGTYKVPTSLFSLVINAIAPKFSFLTPPMHKITGASTVLIMEILASSLTLCCVAAPGGWGSLLIPASLLAAIPILAATVMLSSPRRPPSPEIVAPPLLTRPDAGNPIVFFKRLADGGLLAAKAADGGKPRMLSSNSDERGKAVTFNQFDWQICLETEPVLVKGNAQFATAAFVLEGAAVAFGFVGALLTLVMPVEGFWGLKLAGGVQLLLAYWFMRLAYTLRNIFRWQSDLFSITANGTRTEQFFGGDQAGFKIRRIQSEMHLSVLGTRVISECTDPGVWCADPKYVDNRKGLAHLKSALTTDRYLIETCVDDEFRAKIESILDMLNSFEDSEGQQVRAESEESAGVKKMREGEKNRRQEEMMLQQKLMLQQQMQMMIFGKVLEKMTPEQAQQLLLQGGVLPTEDQAPQQTALAALPAPQQPDASAAPPEVKQPPKSASPTLPAPAVPAASVTNGLAPEIEKHLRNAYSAYFRTFLSPGDTASNRAAKLDVIKSLVRQFKVSKHEFQAIEKEVRRELGIKGQG
jgi:hypothetical protein